VLACDSVSASEFEYPNLLPNGIWFVSLVPKLDITGLEQDFIPCFYPLIRPYHHYHQCKITTALDTTLLKFLGSFYSK
jgi:hypothetical protein